MQENAFDVLRGLLGRAPMSPGDLLRELHQANWPDTCDVHPADFISLGAVVPVTKDDKGMFILIANTTVRPKGAGGHLDLTNYDGPSRIVAVRNRVPEWER